MTFGKKEFAALVAEFLGTGVLTLLVLSVQRSTIGVPFFVAMAAGLTVTLMSLAVAGVSGGHFNPALSIGMWTARKLETVTGILYIAVQLLGGFAAYKLYTYLANSPVQNGADHSFKWRVLTAEAIGAGIFAFAFAAAKYQRVGSTVSAVVAGLGYMIGIVAISAAAIYGFANPAVALGAKSWVWSTYVLGPVIGAVVGVNLYTYLFAGTEGAAAKATVAATTVSSAKPASKAKKSRAKK